MEHIIILFISHSLSLSLISYGRQAHADHQSAVDDTAPSHRPPSGCAFLHLGLLRARATHHVHLLAPTAPARVLHPYFVQCLPPFEPRHGRGRERLRQVLHRHGRIREEETMPLRARELELARRPPAREGSAIRRRQPQPEERALGLPVEGNDGFDGIVPPSEAQGCAGRHRRIVPQGHLVLAHAHVGEGDAALRREFEFSVLLLAAGGVGGRMGPPRGAQARSEDRFGPDATTDHLRRFGRRRREGAVRGGEGMGSAEEGSTRVGGPGVVIGLVVGAEGGEEGMANDGIFVNFGRAREDVPSLWWGDGIAGDEVGRGL